MPNGVSTPRAADELTLRRLMEAEARMDQIEARIEALVGPPVRPRPRLVARATNMGLDVEAERCDFRFVAASLRQLREMPLEARVSATARLNRGEPLRYSDELPVEEAPDDA